MGENNPVNNLAEFIEACDKDNVLAKKYVICNSYQRVSKELELLVDSYANLEILSLEEIAKQIIIMSQDKGGEVKLEMRSNGSLVLVLFKLMRDLLKKKGGFKYFKEPMVDFSTCDDILDNILMIEGNDLDIKKNLSEFSGRSKLKIEDLQILYEKYKEVVNDKKFVFDSATIINYATELADDKNNKVLEKVLDVDAFICFYDDKNYSKNENRFKELVEKKFDSKKVYTWNYDTDINKINTKNLMLVKSYGLHNEIKKVAKDILKKKIDLDTVQVVTANTDNHKNIASYLKSLNIPFYIKEGISCKNTEIYAAFDSLFTKRAVNLSRGRIIELLSNNPAVSVYYLDSEKERLEKIEDEEKRKNALEVKRNQENAFDELEKWIKKGEDEEDRNIDVKKFANAVYKFMTAIEIDSTERIRNNSKELLKKFKDMADELKDNYLETFESACRVVLHFFDGKNILIGEKNELNTDNGSVYISSYQSAPLLFRKNVYFLGFDSSAYPGHHTESPTLLDKERAVLFDEKYEDFEDKNVYSFNAIDRQKEDKINELLCSGLDDKLITMSYSYFNSIDIRKKSPSSIYNELLNMKQKSENAKYEPELISFEANNEKDIIDPLELYLNKNYTYRNDIKKYDDGKVDIKGEWPKDVDGKEEKDKYEKTKFELSATNFDAYMKCQKQFYYKYILRLMPPMEESEDDAGFWLTGADKGTFMHAVLEKYVKEIFVQPLGIELGKTTPNDIVVKAKNLAKSIKDVDKKVLDKYFNEEIINFEKDIPGDKVSKDKEKIILREQIEKELKSIHDNIDKRYPIACEFAFGKGEGSDQELPLKSSNDYFNVTGKIDRIDCDIANNKGFIIVDYKSSGYSGKRAIEDRRSLDDDGYALVDENNKDTLVQDYLYANALSQIVKGLKVSSTEFHFICHNDNNVFRTILVDDEKEKYKTLVSNLKLVKDSIEKNNYNKHEKDTDDKNKKDYTCDNCTYRKMCENFAGDKKTSKNVTKNVTKKSGNNDNKKGKKKGGKKNGK